VRVRPVDADHLRVGVDATLPGGRPRRFIAGGRGREVGALISGGGGCGAEVLVLDGCVRAAAASDPPCSNRKARKQERMYLSCMQSWR
jgi:hypothetical protein